MKRVIKNCLVILLLFMVPTTIFASSYKQQLDDLEQKQKNSQSSIKVNEQQIKELDSDIKDLVGRIVQLDKQIDEFDIKIKDLEQQLSDKEKEIEVTKQDLAKAKEKEEKYFKQTSERMKVMYEQGDSAYIDVVLESKNLSDLLNRVEYINALLEYDTNMIKELETIRDDIAAKESKLEEDKKKIVELKEECNLQKDALEDVQATKEKEMAVLEKDKKINQAEIDAKKKEMEDIAKAIDNIKSKLVYAGGKMAWPTKSHRITCYFGPRRHPITKNPSNHKGIDIGIPSGTSVKAVSNGEVSFAGYSNVWGNYVLIDHGSGYVTIYAHNSKLLVKKGQKVKIGQTIAKSGNTGWSTGPHLHFGIRKNGEWINPLNMLN
ncbi:murein hydrolase activator EnvC family protein [Vallitalea guaymasensis]|uniref:murein hydrolase activator EnvC family protein n=1 Tax=Vallitalea guaymasensis TaxID=1185412 RepID=UPI00235657A9|nr:peptidoglycan DD-metalloendopeptidase family protein [Vallitalea guaymasensis]